MTLLDVSGLCVRYGRIEALHDVGLQVREGEIATVLGANGAGKSTLLRTVLGAVRPDAGEITFAQQAITTLSIMQRVACGIVLVPEGRRIAISMTIEENLLLGAHRRSDRQVVRMEIDNLYDRFPNLAARRHGLAAGLSGGEQQMLAIGRAMLARPRLLMLDEPSLGLSPLFVQRLFDLIVEINRNGTTILLVEQNTAQALRVATCATVLELGRVVMSGDAATLTNHPYLQAAYLGHGQT
ncbi:ABC transporter ATP-binding protein [Komagataeibacter intermedius]|uniref:Amino acid ABC transporter ATPase n=2 Tax=Komagataeibacter intermedius TaxID=66229 RepID=A0A0N1F8T5_9PROT|nr:ABC transporter ATP-binding protein [Komagataeibacter intermedius]KPH86830.1 amino acid ABC transporter ATPase [Komagataeibacter intermedius AF2]MCF3636863.1 ABC transporter ATP-binding protein [Komagataeibacter intermedius]GAN87057.1 ABC transporter [Komagataeibacter intermedius TF2]GBQ71747.1 branched-chain amino acid polysaccharide/polyol phosphate ABC transporter ATP-binding protein [Komagataeibacter intermedius NRIC 0521]